jgi:tRNA A-37 threonylcarbamoyl transferase component Bud32
VEFPARIGKYEIERRIGSGGMAEVYVGKVIGAESFARRVAIKRMLPEYANNETFTSMFVSEAKLTAQLNHSNIVSVVDFDRDPEHGLFLAMEMIDGPDLSRLLMAGPEPLPLSVVIYITAEILTGLGFAHDLPIAGHEIRGIVHRDVSPHNVLMSWHGAVKVSDFGLAKARTATDASASVAVRGKASYMSPEQATAKPLDGRSDLFAVGVMLWEMLTGRTLFGDGGSFDGKLAAVLFLPIPSPREHRPELPADICDVVMRLLERDRERRYPTAEDARQALLACRAANRGAAILELIAILKARFPGQAPQRSSEAGDKARAAPKSALGAFDAVTLLATGQDPPGQFSPAGAAKRARSSAARLALMFAAALVIGVGGTVGVVTLLSRDKAAAAPTPATMTTKEPAIPDVQPRAATTPTAATPAPVALVPAPASTKAMTLRRPQRRRKVPRVLGHRFTKTAQSLPSRQRQATANGRPSR